MSVAEQVEALKQAGNTFWAQKKCTEALEKYSQALLLAPDEPKVLYNRAAV
jgi:hypothetical protein